MKLGIIGCGLMGKEIASAAARWFALAAPPGDLEISAVCDVQQEPREWFHRVPTVKLVTSDYRELLASDVDAVYVAVPHSLHEELYSATVEAGKDLLAEKPFGIDVGSAQRIMARVRQSGSFVRCSSEFPYFPIVQRAIQLVNSGALGQIIEVSSAFLHSSDLDPSKPINWKRQASTCGQIGVMGDLGLHVCHVPFRMGFQPKSVYAQLQNLVPERPDGKGGMTVCDTWDNAMLHTVCTLGEQEVPVRFEMKRMAPGEMNTWEFEALGIDGGVRVSTKHPKTLDLFERGKEQSWRSIDVGYGSAAFPCITGGIFEFGFPDAILQMLAAFVAEREGKLNGRFGCATPEEAVRSHALFDAALRSHKQQSVEKVEP